MSEATVTEPRIPVTASEAADRAEDLVCLIQSLLREGDLLGAKDAAARGVELFSGHPWLAKAERVLNPRGVTVGPSKSPRRDRAKEFAWLQHHSELYRGQWVALDGEQLVASGSQFDDVIEVVRKNPDTHPLVHRVD